MKWLDVWKWLKDAGLRGREARGVFRGGALTLCGGAGRLWEQQLAGDQPLGWRQVLLHFLPLIFLLQFWTTRSYAALRRAADLNWIVEIGYSLGEKILGCS